MKTLLHKFMKVSLASVLLMLLQTGCTSMATRDEMIALETIRAEIVLLERQEQELLKQRSMWTSSIADREAKLKEIEQKKTKLLKYL